MSSLGRLARKPEVCQVEEWHVGKRDERYFAGGDIIRFEKENGIGF